MKEPKVERRIRIHGFQRPFHRLQVVTWVLFALQQMYVLAYLVAGLKYEVPFWKLITLAAVHVLFSLAVVILTVQTTLCDTGAFSVEED